MHIPNAADLETAIAKVKERDEQVAAAKAATERARDLNEEIGKLIHGEDGPKKSPRTPKATAVASGENTPHRSKRGETSGLIMNVLQEGNALTAKEIGARVGKPETITYTSLVNLQKDNPAIQKSNERPARWSLDDKWQVPAGLRQDAEGMPDETPAAEVVATPEA